MFTLSMFHYLQILRTHLKELRYLAYIFGLGTTIMLMTPSCKPKVTLSTPTEGHILVGVDQELMSLIDGRYIREKLQSCSGGSSGI